MNDETITCLLELDQRRLENLDISMITWLEYFLDSESFH